MTRTVIFSVFTSDSLMLSRYNNINHANKGKGKKEIYNNRYGINYTIWIKKFCIPDPQVIQKYIDYQEKLHVNLHQHYYKEYFSLHFDVIHSK